MSHATSKTSVSDIVAAGLAYAVSSLLQGSRAPHDIPHSHEAPRKSARSGADAKAPTDIPPLGWWEVVKRTFTSFSDNRLLAEAAGVTFYMLLALFPGLAAFVSLYGLFNDATTINSHVSSLGGFLPGGALEILSEQVSRISAKGNGALGVSFAIGLVTSLWSANAGVKAIFDALNVVYEERETRSFLALNLLSLTFTLGAIAFGFFALAAITVVPIVLQTVGLGGATQWLLWAARWPALLMGVICGLAILYRFGPSRNDAKWRWITPGSAIAAIGWLAFSMLFSWYVANFGSYNETYGTLGAVIGFMTWIWLSTAIVLIGGAINAELEDQTDHNTKRSGTLEH